MSAIAGIDQALWDIKGKALGVPVYELLGGAVRDRMKIYGWIGGDKPSQVIEGARDRIANGYRAVKMNACSELEWIDSPKKIEDAVNLICKEGNRIRYWPGDRFSREGSQRNG